MHEHCEASKPNPASSKSSKCQPESYVSSEDDSMPSPKQLVKWAAEYLEHVLLHEKSLLKWKFKHHKQSHTQDVEESSSSDEEPVAVRRKHSCPLKAHFVKPSQELSQLKHQMEEDTVEQHVDNTLWGQKVHAHIMSDREL